MSINESMNNENAKTNRDVESENHDPRKSLIVLRGGDERKIRKKIENGCC